MPINGDVLAFFYEYMNDYEVYSMTAVPGGAGFGPKYNIRPVECALIFAPGGKMGIMGSLRQTNSAAIAWIHTDDPDLVKQGDYIDYKGKVYVFEKDNNYALEGGFIRMTVNIVSGVTNKQTTNTKVNPLNDFN